MNIPRITALLGLPLILASCQTPGSDPVADFNLPLQDVKAARPSAYAISSSADEDDLVAAALKHHPSLQAIRSRITALEQSSIQKRALPDPSVSISTGQMAETAAGEVRSSVGFQQKIPFPGKRGAQAIIALRQADAMRAHLAGQELALAEQIRTAYWNYYSASRTVSVVSESKGLLLTLRQSVETRVAANKASQQDLLKLENEITRLDQRLTTSQGRITAAKATLNALLYRPRGSALPSPRAGSAPQYGSPGSLLSRANSRHPEVLAAQARIAAAESGVRLANLKKRPDFTAGIAWASVSSDGLAPSSNGEDQIMGTLGVTLPIWKDKNRAAVGEATANLSAEHSTLASARSALQQRIESAHALHAAERSNLALFNGKLIPDAQQSFDLSVTGYQTDASTFLDVIDAWRQLLGFRLEREENRARLGKADADLRFAAALP